MVKIKDKPILIRDPDAIRLAKERARVERRPYAHAAAVTIIEALGDKPESNDRPGGRNWQGEIIKKNSNPNDNGPGQ
ncbi:hypothetical protein KAR91_61755 [Candidatus Pacearchaeota archaeon]|nr:hypothetical protein [Candidatus Pacearchaeota archaeon]